MKKTALAALLASAVAFAPWQAVEAAEKGDFLHGQRLYSLGDFTGALTAWQPLAQQGDARAQYSLARPGGSAAKCSSAMSRGI